MENLDGKRRKNLNELHYLFIYDSIDNP